jgi:hypothetical protein
MNQEINMEALASELEVTVDYLIEEFLTCGCSGIQAPPFRAAFPPDRLQSLVEEMRYAFFMLNQTPGWALEKLGEGDAP